MEPRTLLSGNGLSSLLSPAALVGSKVAANTPPTIAQPIAINGNAVVTGKTASLSVLGADDGGQANLTYTWSVTTAPTGGNVTFSSNGTNAAQSSTATFSLPGTYSFTVKIVDAGGLSVSSTKSVVVSPTLTGVSIKTASGQVVNPGTAPTVTGVAQSYVVQALDQFGNALSTGATYTWSTTSVPSGAAAPKFSASSNTEVVTFSAAGNYGLTVKVTAGGVSISTNESIVVSPALTSFSIKTAGGQVVNPGTASTVTGVAQSYIVQALDQFGSALSAGATYTWSTTSVPSGAAAPKFSASSNTEVVTFSAAGNYGLTVKVTAGGVSIGTNESIVVSPTLTSVSIKTASGQVVNPGTTSIVTGVAQSYVVQALDQFGSALSTGATYTWSTASTPSGAAAPKLSSSSNTEGVTFSAAGNYGLAVKVTAGGISLSTSVAISVTPVWTSTKYPAVTTVYVSGTSLQPVLPAFLDQFGNPVTNPPALIWSIVYLPSGAPAPTFTTSGNVTTVTFGQAGSYMLQTVSATGSTVSFVTLVTVNQTLTSIAVTPNVATVSQGSNQQLTAQAFDQFKKAMATQPTFLWSSTGGTVSAAGVFTASNSLGNYTVTAKSGTIAGTATVTVQASSGWNSAALASLVKSLDADGSISRQDMIQILTSVANNGPITAGELADLKTILGQATTLNIPGYVQSLAGDIINGNPANATYQGAALGNLAVGSSPTQLTNLINKWFFGTDHPVLCNTSLTYQFTSGSLFPHTPSHSDEYQGMLGDCYLISALGTLADSNPAAIQNMILDNGDGTYTVRFYTGPLGVINNNTGGISAGFSTGVGTADYITVDRMLPAGSTGTLAYADYGFSCTSSANALWIPLIEKAYAQWNQTGKEGRDGTNAFASIQGGWMATVDAQVLGYNATDYIMTTTAEQVAVNALAANEAVTIGTQNWTAATNLGLYANHAYAITAYNSQTDTFTLYNPWGSSPSEIQYQPGQLTWAQLQATCTQLCVCATSGTVPLLGTANIGSTAGSLHADPTARVSLSARLAAAALQPAAGQSGPSADSGDASRQLFWSLTFSEESYSQLSSQSGRIIDTPDASLFDAALATGDFGVR